MGRMTIVVPDVGEGIAEVELVSWAVSEGQPVTRNQMIAEVMTDKATVEVPAPSDGVVGGLTGGVGDILLVGSPLFTLEVAGAGDSASISTDTASISTDTATVPTGTATVANKPSTAPTQLDGRVGGGGSDGGGGGGGSGRGGSAVAPRPEGRKPTATPAVRRRARDAGVDLRRVGGTGPAGRITHEDLDAVFAAPTSVAAPKGHPAGSVGSGTNRGANTDVDDTPVVGLRRKIAEQMMASASTIPHITYVEEVDMTALEELRATLNGQLGNGQLGDGQVKLTLLPFLIRALVRHLPEFPQMNAHVLEQPEGPNLLRSFGGVHVGIAAQTEAGLVVPVLRHAEAETLWGTAERIGQLAEAARDGTADREDLTGSTITITSLGPLGGLVTTPVINKPETTIIGVNKMVVRPVWADGAFVPRKMMNLSSSFDHRVVDGWDAARFIQAVKQSLEQPALLFVDQA